AGASISGEIVGLPDENVDGVFVYVKPVEASGDPQGRTDWKLPTFDGLSLDGNGEFTTERIAPGQYKIIATANRTETAEERGRSGLRLPAWVGSAIVTVPETGEAPRVRVEMKPYSAQEKTEPAQPALPKMVSVVSDAVGVTFDRPADWIVDPAPPPQSGPGVDFLQPDSLVQGVKASLRIWMVDGGSPQSIDVVSPPDPKATASRILTIDGVPARLTAFKAGGDAELLDVTMANGPRLYTMQMVYPQHRHDEYLRLALAVCQSLRLHKPGQPSTRLAGPDNGSLPSHTMTLREAFTGNVTLVVAAEAMNDAALQLGLSGVVFAKQDFRCTEALYGELPAEGQVRVSYSYMDPAMWPNPADRCIRKGEKVIWVVLPTPWNSSSVKAIADTPENLEAVKAIADTPENLEAVKERLAWVTSTDRPNPNAARLDDAVLRAHLPRAEAVVVGKVVSNLMWLAQKDPDYRTISCDFAVEQSLKGNLRAGESVKVALNRVLEPSEQMDIRQNDRLVLFLRHDATKNRWAAEDAVFDVQPLSRPALMDSLRRLLDTSSDSKAGAAPNTSVNWSPMMGLKAQNAMHGVIAALLPLSSQFPAMDQFQEVDHQVAVVNGQMDISINYERNFVEGDKTKSARAMADGMPWCRIAVRIGPDAGAATPLELTSIHAGQVIQWEGQESIRGYRVVDPPTIITIAVQAGSAQLRNAVNRIIDRELTAMIGGSDSLPITADNTSRNIRVVSNPVEIEIIPSDDGVSITGQVTGVTGKPASAYRVTAWPEKWSASWGLMPSVMTDTDGTFTFRGLPDGPCDVSATPVPLTDQPNMRIQGVVLKKKEPVRVTLSLEEKHSFNGRFTDAAGKPLENRDVLAIWKDPASQNTYSSNTKTDAEGRYHFNSSFKTAERILINDNDFHDHLEYRNVQSGRKDVDFQLSASGNQNKNMDATWGEVSNGLQCRLLPAEQVTELAAGDFSKQSVFVTYELRNVSDKAIKFLPWYCPLEGVSGGDVFSVLDEEGNKPAYLGKNADRMPPTKASFITIDPGQTVTNRVELSYDFSKPGTYRV
nr:carboxypeptidase-like regulatory domain-containing protein [Roseovarius sp.]